MGTLVNVIKEKTDDLFTIKEAAEILGASPSAVNLWVRDGRILCVKVEGEKKH